MKSDSPSPVLKTQDQAVQGPLGLYDWLEERRDNCMRILSTKHGEDRAGWIEDAAYFTAACDVIRSARALVEVARAADTLVNRFAWSAVSTDCGESASYLQSLISAVRNRLRKVTVETQQAETEQPTGRQGTDSVRPVEHFKGRKTNEI